MRILVTGAAGFIGFSVCRRLLDQGLDILGIDSLNEYYEPKLKHDRLAQLQTKKNFRFQKLNIASRDEFLAFFKSEKPTRVLHLAAQAGVRYSISNPEAYIEANLDGFANTIENCRNFGIEHLVYASTSSVYGLNRKMPFSVHDSASHPVSLYAATKRANELIAHSYSHLFRLPTTGLRFFTVYGPWGRPDMALFTFTKNILAGLPIEVFNEGKHQRDFTFIDDIAEGVIRVLLGKPPEGDAAWDANRPDTASSSAPYRLYNIGRSSQEELLRYIEVLENCLQKKAQKKMLPLQNGDVPATWADVSDLVRDHGYQPKVSIDQGVAQFVEWYRSYYRV